MALTPRATVAALLPALEQLALSNWTARTSGVASNIYGLTHGNGRWLTCGAAGQTLNSLDAVTWASVVSGTNDLYANVYSLDLALFICVGGGPGVGRIITSPHTAIVWTGRTVAIARQHYSAVWTGAFVVVGGEGSRSFIARSANGTSGWATTVVDQGTTGPGPALAYGNGRIVSCGHNGGYASYSDDDGATWADVTLPAGAGVLTTWPVFCDTFWLIFAANSARVWKSDGGDSWDEIALPFTMQTTHVGIGGGRSAWWNGLRAVAVGPGGRVYSSSDGVAWVQHAGSGTANQVNAVAHNGLNFWTAVGNGGIIRTSLALDP